MEVCPTVGCDQDLERLTEMDAVKHLLEHANRVVQISTPAPPETALDELRVG